jgi:NADH:ubiquinone oxidoreductase subunit 4 (subunit M)
MYQRTAFGVPKPEFEHAHIHDVHTPEWIAWVPMLVVIVALGFYPHALFRTMDGAVHRATQAVPAAPAVAQAAP